MEGLAYTYSLQCSSFLGLPYRILLIYLVKPKKGTTMETIGSSFKGALTVRPYGHRCGRPGQLPGRRRGGGTRAPRAPPGGWGGGGWGGGWGRGGEAPTLR